MDIKRLFDNNFDFAFKAATYNNIKVAIQTFEQFKKKNEDFFSFDKILLDAPCSGSGTLDAYNEASKKNFTTKLIQKSVEAQTALLKKALKVLKTGGEMIYSTCSVLESENEKVLENVLRTAKAQIVPISLDKAQFPLLDVKIPGTICVCPNEYFEGFFIAKIKKM